jgi:hypothetical protein
LTKEGQKTADQNGVDPTPVGDEGA